jgi:endoglucanase
MQSCPEFMNAPKTAGANFAPNEPIDVLLNTEAGAILLAQVHSGSDGAIPPAVIKVGHAVPLFKGLTTSGLGFTVPNSDLGQVDVPLRDEQYQLDVIGESVGDGGSLQLDFAGGNLTGSKTIGTTAGTGCTPATPPAMPPLQESLPLSTNGRWIVAPPDPALGGYQPRVKLASVNWYGAEEADFVVGGLNCQSLATIAQIIQDDGFNSVRLPWSNAMLEENPPPCDPATTIGKPCIDPWFVHADPSLAGKSALTIYQDVIATLTSHGIMTVLDDHTTDAEFCCIARVNNQYAGFNGLWWGGQLWDDAFPMTHSSGNPHHWRQRQGLFQTDWHKMVTLVGNYQDVVGADLRNEPDGAYGMQASWDGQGAYTSTPTNWQEAAREAAAAVLAVNPDLLIMVEGTGSGTDLSKVPGDPLRLSVNGTLVSDKLVYSPHAYSFDNFGSDYSSFTSTLGSLWGVILTQGQPYTAPIWIGEFGANASQAAVISPPSTCSGDSAFLNCFLNYIQGNDADWAWWALNGTVSDSGALVDNTGTLQKERPWFSQESYGILDTRWTNSASPLIDDLKKVEQPTQFPPP